MPWPQFKISFPFQEIAALAQRAQTALSQRTEIRRELADTLQKLIRQDFQTKSQGGMGVDGIHWAPRRSAVAHRKRPRPIGVHKGTLSNSLKVESGVGRVDVVAKYIAPHAEVFDKQRPLLPESCPQEWQALFDNQVAAWAEQRIQKEVQS